MLVDSALAIAITERVVDPTEIYKLFGKRLAAARVAAKLTQQELSERVGMSRASIANIEAGRQRVVLHQIIELSDKLRSISAADLLLLDLLRPDELAPPMLDLTFTGSQVSSREADDIARIVASS